MLKVGESPGWLPTHEAGQHGSGTLCQIGITNAKYYGAKYVPFVKNGINWIEQGEYDVISYNFTGCLMAAFTFEKKKRICHVSTGEGQDCLPEWRKIKAKSVNVFEFRPSDFIDAKGGAFNGCYGLITRSLQVYSITIVRGNEGLKIASIVPARLLRG